MTELLYALANTAMTYSASEPLRKNVSFTDWMVYGFIHSTAQAILVFIFTLILAFCSNHDTFTKNYYMYHDPNIQDFPFRFIPWDMDATWGNTWTGAAATPRTDLYGLHIYNFV